MLFSSLTTSQNYSMFYVIVSKGTHFEEYGEGSSITVNKVQINFSV